jgi:hypothetical protein
MPNKYFIFLKKRRKAQVATSVATWFMAVCSGLGSALPDVHGRSPSFLVLPLPLHENYLQLLSQ